jgi:hypothetical protein
MRWFRAFILCVRQSKVQYTGTSDNEQDNIKLHRGVYSPVELYLNIEINYFKDIPSGFISSLNGGMSRAYAIENKRSNDIAVFLLGASILLICVRLTFVFSAS